jgi:hypothetical protein
VAKRQALEEELRAAQSTVQSLGTRLDQSDWHMLTREVDNVRQTYEVVTRAVDDRRTVVDVVKRDVEDVCQNVAKVDDFLRRQDQLLAEKPSGQWHATRAAELMTQLKVRHCQWKLHCGASARRGSCCPKAG